MKDVIVALVIVASLGGCTAGVTTYRFSSQLEPIPGSITYGGQPRSRLTKAPVGSIVPHQFRDQFGRPVSEIYVIEPDRSLRLVSRRWRAFDVFSDD